MNFAGENGPNGPDGARLNGAQALKNAAFGRYQAREDEQAQFEKQQQRLALKAAHKALDIPQADDDMNVTSTTTTNNHYPAPASTTPAPSKIPPWLLALLAAGGLAIGLGGAGIGTGIIRLPTAPGAVVPGDSGTDTWISADNGKTWKQVPLTSP